MTFKNIMFTYTLINTYTIKEKKKFLMKTIVYFFKEVMTFGGLRA